MNVQVQSAALTFICCRLITESCLRFTTLTQCTGSAKLLPPTDVGLVGVEPETVLLVLGLVEHVLILFLSSAQQTVFFFGIEYRDSHCAV